MFVYKFFEGATVEKVWLNYSDPWNFCWYFVSYYLVGYFWTVLRLMMMIGRS